MIGMIMRLQAHAKADITARDSYKGLERKLRFIATRNKINPPPGWGISRKRLTEGAIPPSDLKNYSADLQNSNSVP